MVGLLLCVYVKKELKVNISDIQIISVKTGFAGFHGNKVMILQAKKKYSQLNK